MIFQTKNETKEWAERLAACLRPGDVIRLDGDLGAGKTQLVQWVGQALSVDQEITSPTFSLVRSYRSDLGGINHLDLYRMEDQEEVEELDVDVLFYPEEAITFIEWADRAEDYLPADIIHLRIRPMGGEMREISWLSETDRTKEIEAAIADMEGDQ